MSKYKGLFTFDEYSHKYIPIPIAGAGGIIDTISHESAEPLIKDEKIRKAVRAWWESIPMEAADKLVLYKKNEDLAVGVYKIYCGAIYPDDTLKAGKTYTIAELCGEEEE